MKTDQGKDGVIGKSKEQLILDLQEKHTVDNWILSEEYENSKLNEDPNENTGLFVVFGGLKLFEKRCLVFTSSAYLIKVNDFLLFVLSQVPLNQWCAKSFLSVSLII